MRALLKLLPLLILLGCSEEPVSGTLAVDVESGRTLWTSKSNGQLILPGGASSA